MSTDNLDSRNEQAEEPLQGPTLVPISLAIGTDTYSATLPVEEPTTIPVFMQLPSNLATESIGLEFYEVTSTGLSAITLVNPPIASWNNGIASFTLDIDYQFVSLLSSSNTTVMIIATSGDYTGQCSFGVNLPPILK